MFMEVLNPYGSEMLMTYKIEGIHPKETFRLLINGKVHFAQNEDTVFHEDGINLEPTNE